jgi:hypothetical protein
MREIYKLSEETLFHAVTYMDMYLQRQPVPLSELALLSTTCLLISSKNNEIYQIKINKLIEQRKRAFDRDDVLSMENNVLIALDFKLAIPSLYELYRSSEVQYQLCEDRIVTARKDVIVKVLYLCLCDQTMMEYGYNMCALAAIVLFSKYRAVSNKPISSELETLRTKSPSLSRACDKLYEIVSDAKLRNKLSSLSNRSVANNP